MHAHATLEQDFLGILLESKQRNLGRVPWQLYSVSVVAAPGLVAR
jgi:hypothetical protein